MTWKGPTQSSGPSVCRRRTPQSTGPPVGSFILWLLLYQSFSVCLFMNECNNVTKLEVRHLFW